ncbi:hypothetical protein Taro_038614 [Colocasia esculenta]|uniref:RNase H type-1 domain-containing protein n=1 Tax=Colocasia esculenta TaxID=4460 RepID=A0A843WJS7_COLES|nr:hypothetical protein [Colocasia esculenta]
MFDDVVVDEEAMGVAARTMQSVRTIVYSFHIKGKDLSPWQRSLLTSWGIKLEAVQLAPPRLIRWFTPPPGGLKLNVDGAFKRSTGVVGGRGILRNSNGDIVFAYAAAYSEVNSSIEAEALALCDGLSICCDMGIHSAAVESDSLVLVQIINGKSSCPWRLLYIMHDVSIKCRLVRISVSHVYREANQDIKAQMEMFRIRRRSCDFGRFTESSFRRQAPKSNMELFLFGRPKRGKSASPPSTAREAASSTRSKHILGHK